MPSALQWSMVNPFPAKLSVIDEQVLLLENTCAAQKFFIFGNKLRLPEEWLKRYGELAKSIDFFFYDIRNGHLDKLG